jgi:hypothetical protein
MSHDTPFSRPLPLLEQPQQAMTALLTQVQDSHPLTTPQSELVVVKRGRPARLSALMLAHGIVWCLLHGWRSQLALWRHLVLGFGSFVGVQISDQAVYKRLAQDAGMVMQPLCTQVTDWLGTWLAPYEDRSLAPFATNVYALDECSLKARKRWVAELFGVPRGDDRLLGGKCCCVMDLRRQLIHSVLRLPAELSKDQTHSKPLVEQLPRWSLVLFDLGFFSLEWFDHLSELGLWWISRIKHNTSYHTEHVLVERDGYYEALVFLGAYRSDRSAYLYRLVKVRYRGRWYRYVTNQTDFTRLSGADVVRLYARRWDIELSFRLLQDHLQLRMLWSAKPQVIEVQIWATFVLVQLYHALQVCLAAQLGVDTFDISLDLLVHYLPELHQQAQRRRCSLTDLIKQVGEPLGLVRPHTRLHIQVPLLALHEIQWPPATLLWRREPRYSHKQKGGQARSQASQNASSPN